MGTEAGVAVPRRERTAQVRAEVLDAARREFLVAGYHGASLDRIAASAGFTKGAVYSRFASKADLFIALLEARIDARAQHNAALAAGLSGRDGLVELLRRANEQQEADLPWTLLVLEFRVHAARHPQLNARYAALHERTLDGLAAAFAAVLGDERTRLRDLARQIVATGNGVAVEQAVAPGSFSPEAVTSAITAIVCAQLGGEP